MEETVSNNVLSHSVWFELGWLILAGALIGLSLLILPQLIEWFILFLLPMNYQEVYEKTVTPYNSLIGIALGLGLADLTIIVFTGSQSLIWLEILLSLSFTMVTAWLLSRIAQQFFDVYLIDIAVKSGRKVNSELIIVGKFITNFTIIVFSIIIFAQTHHINVIGLIASLGVGGLAVAFAAQSILSQILGGIVLYIDRPFMVDDYIGLPDGTFGRVESIGLRSTKIRTSGKGTLVIVPNSSLTQVNIENFTGAKKVMSILALTFYQEISPEEQALIREVILSSSQDIFGIDPQNTDVKFKSNPIHEGKVKTQAQITFFILGSGQVSMELRRQMLDIASQNITFKLKEYGIEFEIEEPSIYVDSPITI